MAFLVAIIVTGVFAWLELMAVGWLVLVFFGIWLVAWLIIRFLLPAIGDIIEGIFDAA